MNRIYCILGVAFLGVGLYMGDAPRIAAEEAPQPRVVAEASTEPQSTVARLAEASLAMRRAGGEPVVVTTPEEPRPEKLFHKK